MEQCKRCGSDAVEYIRKDKCDELIQQIMWQYAGSRIWMKKNYQSLFTVVVTVVKTIHGLPKTYGGQTQSKIGIVIIAGMLLMSIGMMGHQ